MNKKHTQKTTISKIKTIKKAMIEFNIKHSRWTLGNLQSRNKEKFKKIFYRDFFDILYIEQLDYSLIP